MKNLILSSILLFSTVQTAAAQVVVCEIKNFFGAEPNQFTSEVVQVDLKASTKRGYTASGVATNKTKSVEIRVYRRYESFATLSGGSPTTRSWEVNGVSAKTITVESDGPDFELRSSAIEETHYDRPVSLSFGSIRVNCRFPN
ncbi:MAG TPA: hypothetical protein PLZ57_16290 [Pseudobdellovibrionaceae bacterium]|nr:hypothetical protein [Pseudobdellovibrionaceae bacterium]